jgi:predicted RNA-binding protein with RPS1 domain
MVTPQPLPEGSVVTARVTGHQQWGVEVTLLPPAPNISGLIDVMYVTNERPFEPFTDYPDVGQIVKAVVMPYPPNGQLRLSTRNSDLDRVLNDNSRG